MKTVFYRAAERVHQEFGVGRTYPCCLAISFVTLYGSDSPKYQYFFEKYFLPDGEPHWKLWWDGDDMESRILALLLADILWREAHPPKRKKYRAVTKRFKVRFNRSYNLF